MTYDQGVLEAHAIELEQPCAADCPSFRPGHRVHPMQAKLSRRSQARQGTVAATIGQWALVAYDDGDRDLFWHHHGLDQRLVTGQRVGLASHGVLRVDRGDGGCDLLSVEGPAD